jgi:hypothetical protein
MPNDHFESDLPFERTFDLAIFEGRKLTVLFDVPDTLTIEQLRDLHILKETIVEDLRDRKILGPRHDTGEDR